MKEAAGKRWGDLLYLLGGYSRKRELRTGKPADGPMEKWAPDLEMVKITIQFLQLGWGLRHYRDRARKGRDRGVLNFYQIELEIKQRAQ
jgi:hypothetical protein